MKKNIELIVFMHVRSFINLSVEIAQIHRFLSMLVFASFLRGFFLPVISFIGHKLKWNTDDSPSHSHA